MLDILDLKEEKKEKETKKEPVKPKIDYLARYKVYLGYILN